MITGGKSDETGKDRIQAEMGKTYYRQYSVCYRHVFHPMVKYAEDKYDICGDHDRKDGNTIKRNL